MQGRSTRSSGAASAVRRLIASAMTTSVSTGRWRPWSSSVAAGRSATLPASAASFTSGQLSFENSYVMPSSLRLDGAAVLEDPLDVAERAQIRARVPTHGEQIGAHPGLDAADLALEAERGGRDRRR